MDIEKELKLYEDQTLLCENYFFQGSEDEYVLDVLNKEERMAFNEYFMPDWDHIEDYREYYKQITANNPELKIKANKALNKVLDIFYPNTSYDRHPEIK